LRKGFVPVYLFLQGGFQKNLPKYCITQDAKRLILDLY
jgi:hypothetical protein